MVVIDASVVFKWFAEDESNFEEALQILQDHRLNKSLISAPQLLIYELTNAWVTKTKITLKNIKANLKKLEKAAIQLENVTFTRAEKAIEFASNYHISVYDASYVVLAQEKQCSLITADARLVERINLPFVKLLSDLFHVTM
ncbi:type II toxin-antitoxin system VapC family toxin [Candidatus Microgenomates bacterium]|nr:type II toxin-antitoxin system VapC family toxin [Candidatus Microgenomates bacterium]